MNNTKSLLSHLFSLHRGDIKPGTDRVLCMLNALGNPHLLYPTIHVAGTNGKGSITSLIASILQESGYKVGLYTSPHIFSFNERIRIDGIPIPDEHITTTYDKIDGIARQINATFFEITTAIAFHYFMQQRVNIAIVETGLGGAFDATNVIAPIISIITSISIDHTEYLGNTLMDIAREKIEIIKPATPVLSVNNKPEIVKKMLEKAKEVNSKLYVLNDYPHVDIISYTNDLKMCIEIVDLMHRTKAAVVSPLIGENQAMNINAAMFAIQMISSVFDVKTDNIVKGIERVRENTGLHFRIECVHTDPLVIIDVAHNIASISSLINALDEASTIDKWNFVFGAMHDKKIDEMLKIIATRCNNLIVVQPDIQRAETAETIATIAAEVGIEKIHTAKTPSNAVELIKKFNEPTIICGSFYVAEELALALKF